jgi:ubiquinone/menaquinone biosynthesis C-methylase UbiE
MKCDLAAGLPYPDESFDYIICLEVIEHVDNPMALCREIGRVLRKGGRLICPLPIFST